MNKVGKLVLGFAAGVMLMAAGQQVFAEEPAVEKGKEVPEFTATSLDGKAVSFKKDILGKKLLTVVVFMQTACGACANEMDLVAKFHSANKDKVAFYAVATDMAGEKAVKPYVERNNYGATFLLDPEFKIPAMFGFSFTPSMAAIAKDGTLAFKFGGFGGFTKNQLQSQLDAAIK